MYTHTQAHVVQTQDEGFKIVGEFLLTGLCAYQRATIFTTATCLGSILLDIAHDVDASWLHYAKVTSPCHLHGMWKVSEYLNGFGIVLSLAH